MSWRYSDITFRPIDNWPGEQTRYRRASAFSAAWGSTVDLLERELRALNARLVVLQIAIGESDLRIDGKPRAQARASHPGVILAFESKHGPIKFAVDTYTTWQDNLRAVALAMEALRKVDRYGVTKRGEQYTGWRAIPQTTSDGITTREQARAFIDEHGGSYREAAKRLHPDMNGGDEEMFKKLGRARELLGTSA